MPIRHRGAQRAPFGTPFAGAITWLRSPRPVFGALALALLVPFAPLPSVASGVAAASARCGTWTSRVTPPPSIRVLRTSTGIVEEVPFATYVATVMASGEWPTSLPTAALQAGATASKQYAWYYALKGNHRADYRTKSGACYDVRDDTMDQLYRPETAKPTQKQLDALAATWALSLRKHGRFFLTGYRAGSNVGCAHDADGWRLYASSITHCAKQGWSRVKIQERYYAPHLGFVWDYATPVARSAAAATTAARSDRRAPIALAPQLGLRTGATLDGRLGRVQWAGADAGSGLAAFQVQQRVDDGPWTDVTPAQARARAVNVSLDPTAHYEMRVRSIDGAGNVSDWAPSDMAIPAIVESGTADHTGPWSAIKAGAASGGSVLRTRKSGAAMSIRFKGSSVAIVAPTGRTYGKVRIRIGGAVVATVDLGRLPASDGRVIWSHSWHGDRSHRVGLVVAHAPGPDQVDVDAFVVVH